MEYYYTDGKNSIGPFSQEQLRQLLHSNVIQGTTLVVEKGGSSWVPVATVLGGAQGPAVQHFGAAPVGPNNPVSTGLAIVWFLFCIPIGFISWGQVGKGFVWIAISFATAGLGIIPAWIDYWMCFTAQQKRRLEPWEFFPRS